MSVFPTACGVPTCSETTTKRWCEDHYREKVREKWKGYENRPNFRERGYDSRWTRLSESYRKRHPLCEPCEARGKTRPAELVHHVWPVEQGGPMYDEENLESRCRPCHDRAHRQGAKQYAETTVICGPPGAGKTTYAEEQKRWGDLIVDVDYLWCALTGLEMHAKPDPVLPLVLDVRDLLLEKLRRPQWIDRAWVVATAPEAKKRMRLASDLDADVKLLLVEPEECKRRLRESDRTATFESQAKLVDDWWSKYEPWERDEVVTDG